MSKKDSKLSVFSNGAWYKEVLFMAIIHFLVSLLIGFFRSTEMDFVHMLISSLIFGFIWLGIIKIINKTDNAWKK